MRRALRVVSSTASTRHGAKLRATHQARDARKSHRHRNRSTSTPSPRRHRSRLRHLAHSSRTRKSPCVKFSRVFRLSSGLHALPPSLRANVFGRILSSREPQTPRARMFGCSLPPTRTAPPKRRVRASTQTATFPGGRLLSSRDDLASVICFYRLCAQ